MLKILLVIHLVFVTLATNAQTGDRDYTQFLPMGSWLTPVRPLVLRAHSQGFNIIGGVPVWNRQCSQGMFCCSFRHQVFDLETYMSTHDVFRVVGTRADGYFIVVYLTPQNNPNFSDTNSWALHCYVPGMGQQPQQRPRLFIGYLRQILRGTFSLQINHDQRSITPPIIRPDPSRWQYEETRR